MAGKSNKRVQCVSVFVFSVCVWVGVHMCVLTLNEVTPAIERIRLCLINRKCVCGNEHSSRAPSLFSHNQH